MSEQQTEHMLLAFILSQDVWWKIHEQSDVKVYFQSNFVIPDKGQPDCSQWRRPLLLLPASKLTGNTKLAKERESFSQNKNKCSWWWLIRNGVQADHREGRISWSDRDCFVLHFIQTWNFNSNQDVGTRNRIKFRKDERFSENVAMFIPFSTRVLWTLNPEECIELHPSKFSQEGFEKNIRAPGMQAISQPGVFRFNCHLKLLKKTGLMHHRLKKWIKFVEKLLFIKYQPWNVFKGEHTKTPDEERWNKNVSKQFLGKRCTLIFFRETNWDLCIL